ncbi:MAG TPA: GDSL-type esterase/lipase family protein [Solirubrobacteraceae bacterium]
MPSLDAEAAPRRVLFLGDSLMAGVGDPTGGGWVARVVAECFARGLPVTAYNLGVRRETSVQVTARWRAEALPRVPPGADARIVVSFGANDTTAERGAIRVPAERSRLALEQLLDETATSGFAVYVVGPAPVDDEEQNHRIEALSATFAEVCHRHAVPFAPLVEQLSTLEAWMSEIADTDGAHPGASGYQTLAATLIDHGLCDWLTSPVETQPPAS